MFTITLVLTLSFENQSMEKMEVSNIENKLIVKYGKFSKIKLNIFF
ncbi:hypothetical protein HMPREF1984_00912 [Leptotrichia sp. oral taxon 215 str. W9775]|nr:hypothetical protein HMPREF1984_00912 [Leptotrichia sp. oral taxon 215 str. W9775]